MKKPVQPPPDYHSDGHGGHQLNPQPHRKIDGTLASANALMRRSSPRTRSSIVLRCRQTLLESIRFFNFGPIVAHAPVFSGFFATELPGLLPAPPWPVKNQRYSPPANP
jgi:hypothetical protein